MPSCRLTERRSRKRPSNTGCPSPPSRPRRGPRPSRCPEPPNYKACIAHLKKTREKKKNQSLTDRQLKNQCETQYKSLQQEVLGFLISSEWVIGEAKALGVKITDAEVKKQFEKIKSQQFPKAAEFEKFLASSGQTVSDLLLRVKLNLLSSKIQQKIPKEKAAPSRRRRSASTTTKTSPSLGRPKSATCQLVLTKTEAEAKKAKQEIESGKSFASVAKRVSIDPTSKANGGKLTGVVKGQEEPGAGRRRSSRPKKLTGP